MKGKFFSLCLILAMLCSGCLSGSPPTQVSAPAHTEMTAQPTSRFTVILETPLPSGTSTPLPAASLTTTPTYQEARLLPSQNIQTIKSCVNNGSPIPAPNNFGFKSSIFYLGRDLKGLYQIDGESLKLSESTIYENQPISAFGFSKDGKWLAYSPINDHGSLSSINHPTLILQSYDGKKEEYKVDLSKFNSMVPKEMQLAGWSGNWLNNNTVDFSIIYNDPTKVHGNKFLQGFYDPFVRDWENSILQKLVNRDDERDIGLSPDMTRALYPTKTGIELWNLNENIKLWADEREDLTIFPSPLMEWSPDSSMVAYKGAVDGDLYLLSRSGEIWKQVRKLESPGKTTDFEIVRFNWAPDSRLLALEVAISEHGTDNDTKYAHAIYAFDILFDKYIYQCPYSEENGSISRFFWSPDQRFLTPAISLGRGPLLLYDLDSDKVIQLEQEGATIGWSDQFPGK